MRSAHTVRFMIAGRYCSSPKVRFGYLKQFHFFVGARRASIQSISAAEARAVYHAEIVNPPLGAETMNFSISESVIEVTFPSAGSVTLYEDHPPMAAVMAM